MGVWLFEAWNTQNNNEEFSSSFTEYIVNAHYKEQSMNAVQWNDHCLF